MPAVVVAALDALLELPAVVVIGALAVLVVVGGPVQRSAGELVTEEV